GEPVGRGRRPRLAPDAGGRMLAGRADEPQQPHGVRFDGLARLDQREARHDVGVVLGHAYRQVLHAGGVPGVPPAEQVGQDVGDPLLLAVVRIVQPGGVGGAQPVALLAVERVQRRPGRPQHRQTQERAGDLDQAQPVAVLLRPVRRPPATSSGHVETPPAVSSWMSRTLRRRVQRVDPPNGPRRRRNCLYFTPSSGYTFSMSTMPFTEARNRLSELVDEVERTHERIKITKHGRTVAVLLSPDDLAALEETLDVLGSPEAMRQLAESRAAIAEGDVLDAEELAEVVSERRRKSPRR